MESVYARRISWELIAQLKNRTAACLDFITKQASNANAPKASMDLIVNLKTAIIIALIEENAKRMGHAYAMRALLDSIAAEVNLFFNFVKKLAQIIVIIEVYALMGSAFAKVILMGLTALSENARMIAIDTGNVIK